MSSWRENPALLLKDRIDHRSIGWRGARSKLFHFSLITYAVPIERLRPHIPDPFEICPFSIGGETKALISAVPFLDVDFHFVRLLPFLKFQFGQTNHRAYVIDKRTGEPAAWFFGTTLGSRLVHVSQALWRLPWHYARYTIECDYDESARRYSKYRYQIQSPWCEAEIDVEDTGRPVTQLEGFSSEDEMALVLTHPAEGYFYRRDGRVGTYGVWHRKMDLTLGRPKTLYFSLYEKLGLLSRDEMKHPHSILIAQEVEFDIHLPPRRY